MFGKREYSTVVFSDSDQDVVTVGSIIMVVTGDKGTYYASGENRQWFVKAKTTAFRYWLAKRFINKYCAGVCGFDCPSEVC